LENQKIVIGNLKTVMNINDVSSYLKTINKEIVNKQVVICPTNIYIPYFLKNGYSVGLQDIFINEDGPYTGEVTPNQAISMGIKYAIIGHSERRTHLNEPDEIINKKVISAVQSNMQVILCVGETLEEKQMLKTDVVLRRQLVNALNGLNIEMLHNVTIAYEPVWAIGTDNVASNKEIERTTNYIKMIVHQNRGYKNMRVIYGGSVNDKNIKELNKIKNISGFLVGGAAADSEKFLTIINEVVVNQ
jgi:triosephosphate isomerase